jgi:SAM-dependent methyltransferase
VGDARALERPTASVDALLLLGPLYHLTERDDRIRALREARRVLRPGGILFAAVISRFASLVDNLTDSGGTHTGLPPVFADAAVLRMVQQDLADGQHRNPAPDAPYFTTAFFHHPEELAAEVREADLALIDLLAVEGLGALTSAFAGAWAHPVYRETLLTLVRSLEREPSLIGVSPHLLAVARRD